MTSALLERSEPNGYAAIATMPDIHAATISDPERSYQVLSIVEADIRAACWVAYCGEFVGVYAFHPLMHQTAAITGISYQNSGRTAPLSNWPAPAQVYVNSLAEEVNNLLESGNEDAALKAVARAARRAKETENFAKLSHDLECFEISRYTDVILVALVRNTFSLRAELPAWPDLLTRIEIFFNNKKQGSAGRLLRGLSLKS